MGDKEVRQLGWSQVMESLKGQEGGVQDNAKIAGQGGGRDGRAAAHR